MFRLVLRVLFLFLAFWSSRAIRRRADPMLSTSTERRQRRQQEVNGQTAAYSLEERNQQEFDRGTSSSSGRRRVVVEGSLKALRLSPNTVPDELVSEQNHIIETISNRFPEGSVHVLHVEQNLANAIFLSLPITDDDQHVDQWIRSTLGVVGVSKSVDFEEEGSLVSRIPLVTSEITIANASTNERGTLALFDQIPDVREIAESYLNAAQVHKKHCLTGQGVRVAIIDSGIDYTHSVFGGQGTKAAYNSAAATNNPRASGLFPTARVVDGRNFLSSAGGGSDTNPLDQPAGHGTGVATAIVGMAPDAQIVAAKVCNQNGLCPDYAVIAAIDYAYETGVDVINISLGQSFANGYYHILGRVIEEATALLGMNIVVPSGNYGNKPFIMGGIANVANAFTVGATTTGPYGFMAPFSSRGPGTLNNLKPDICAPGAKMVVAESGSGTSGATAEGTSFSSPIVAGAAALIKSKCSECSAFAIKAILMNNARRVIQKVNGNGLEAPVSWAGSGEVDILQAVEATFWAYSIEDRQPSISLGIVDVASNMVIRRQIQITGLSAECQGFKAKGIFRKMQVKAMGAMKIVTISTSSTCQNAFTITVEFHIDAARVPTNRMTSGGSLADKPSTLEGNEFDGWIAVTSTSGKEVNIPFHGIFRKAADVTVGVKSFPSKNVFPSNFAVGLTNYGAGIAQVDLYELLATSGDDPEPKFGSKGNLSPPADFKYIGYRTLQDENCGFIIEFAFQLWERRQTLFNTEIRVGIDIDRDRQDDFILANRGPRSGPAGNSDCRIQSVSGGDWECTGFIADHATNSATIVIRACSNDLGVSPFTKIGVHFASATYPQISEQTDSSGYMEISVPATTGSIPTSFDLAPGEQLSEILSNTKSISNSYALGLLMLTNGYRGPDNTGAAVASSEALVIPFQGIQIPTEKTADNLSFMQARYISGPGNGWSVASSTCQGTRKLSSLVYERHGIEIAKYNKTIRHMEECSEKQVPRVFLPIPAPIQTKPPRPINAPIKAPTPMGVKVILPVPTAVPSFRSMAEEEPRINQIGSSPSQAQEPVYTTSASAFHYNSFLFWPTALVAVCLLIA